MKSKVSVKMHLRNGCFDSDTRDHQAGSVSCVGSIVPFSGNFAVLSDALIGQPASHTVWDTLSLSLTISSRCF